jgi:ech hydrogenase subunit C
VFKENYTVLGGVDKVVPVNAYIPGCPPKPEAIIDGVVKLLSSLESSKPEAKTSASA